MKVILSVLFIAVMFVTGYTSSQDNNIPTSLGASLYDKVQNNSPVSDVFVAPGTRQFTWLNGAAMGKGFLSACALTTVGAPPAALIGGAVYANGLVYVYLQGTPFTLYTVDTVTGAYTALGGITGIPPALANLTGMAWDPTTSTMFGLVTSCAASQIGSLNLATRVFTPLGASAPLPACPITLGCSPVGTLYSLDIVADNLYKYNKVTGVGTLVGPLALDINNAQDGQFDMSDGKFYVAAYQSTTLTGTLRTVDTATGTVSAPICSYTAEPLGIALPTAPPAPPAAGWCEGFTGVTFPPTGWTLTGAALLWSRNAVSGFGVGVGSAKADFYSVGSGNQQLNTIVIPTPTAAGDSLIFQDAYCTFSTENDQLQIQTSTNGGTTWVPLVTLNGGVAGQLVTAPPQSAAFTPTAAQWKYQRLALPVGVNRVQFNAISAFGNNLYIDSICYKPNIVGISNNNTVAKEFSLSQNYPNPFNPTTNIKFGLPTSGNVKLVVFDILGREVTTLVNEYKTSGIYTVDFDASLLSSGVYFYRIESGNFVETKKMLLVK